MRDRILSMFLSFFLSLYHYHLVQGQVQNTTTEYFTHLLNKYLLNTYYGPGIVLSGEDIGVNKIDESF